METIPCFYTFIFGPACLWVPLRFKHNRIALWTVSLRLRLNMPAFLHLLLLRTFRPSGLMASAGAHCEHASAVLLSLRQDMDTNITGICLSGIMEPKFQHGPQHNIRSWQTSTTIRCPDDWSHADAMKAAFGCAVVGRTAAHSGKTERRRTLRPVRRRPEASSYISS